MKREINGEKSNGGRTGKRGGKESFHSGKDLLSSMVKDLRKEQPNCKWGLGREGKSSFTKELQTTKRIQETKGKFMSELEPKAKEDLDNAHKRRLSFINEQNSYKKSKSKEISDLRNELRLLRSEMKELGSSENDENTEKIIEYFSNAFLASIKEVVDALGNCFLRSMLKETEEKLKKQRREGPKWMERAKSFKDYQDKILKEIKKAIIENSHLRGKSQKALVEDNSIEHGILENIESESFFQLSRNSEASEIDILFKDQESKRPIGKLNGFTKEEKCGFQERHLRNFNAIQENFEKRQPVSQKDDRMCLRCSKNDANSPNYCRFAQDDPGKSGSAHSCKFALDPLTQLAVDTSLTDIQAKFKVLSKHVYQEPQPSEESFLAQFSNKNIEKEASIQNKTPPLYSYEWRDPLKEKDNAFKPSQHYQKKPYKLTQATVDISDVEDLDDPQQVSSSFHSLCLESLL